MGSNNVISFVMIEVKSILIANFDDDVTGTQVVAGNSAWCYLWNKDETLPIYWMMLIDTFIGW